MGDLADVYESTRRSILDVISEHPDDLEREVPATPGWRVRDVVAHLVGDVECITRGDFPMTFFNSFGDRDALVELNEWTGGQVEARAGRPFEDVVEEWDKVAENLEATMRGERDWAQGVPPFADRVLITDLGVHQQDIFGAFGIESDREGAPIKIGVAGYIAIMDLRLRNDDGGTLTFEAPGKSWTAGQGEPQATVRASRFELFRALSGRRNVDQLLAFDWDGDPQPFISYFYPYGVREDALVE
jgi:uncharacterized protein (TIGR03083 family)